MLVRRRGISKDYWAVLGVMLVASSIVTYSFAYGVGSGSNNVKILQLQKLVSALQNQNQGLLRELNSTGSLSNVTLISLNPVAVYAKASPSVVTVMGQSLGGGSVLGSGFITLFQGAYYIVTNYHVVHGVLDISVTFSDGNAYAANVLGTDAYVDLAVLNITAPAAEFHPLSMARSSQLRVGEPVVAIGNPFGLAGSMTFGIISQTGRTLSESLAGSFAIADVIQFSAPINPGNSGGPLFNANGSVIGITTAIVSSSQGVGFAIPADAIQRELPSLITTGGYTMHSLLGIAAVDMNLQLAGFQGTNVTYGSLIENVTAGGPAANGGIRGGNQTVQVLGGSYAVGGDIIVSINGTKIVNTDALSSYLQENTLPGQTIRILVVRNGAFMTLNVILGTRPPPPAS